MSMQPLPVLTGALKRLSQDMGESSVRNPPRIEELIGRITSVANLSLQAHLSSPSSGTPLTNDLKFVLCQHTPSSAAFDVYSGYASRQLQKYMSSTTTNDVYFRLANEQIRQIAELLIPEHQECEDAQDSSPRNSRWAFGPNNGGQSSTSSGSVEDRHDWLRRVYELVGAKNSRGAMRVVFASVEDLMRRGEVVALNEVVLGVDLARLDERTMVALVRISARARKAMPGWQFLLSRVRAELGRLNVKDIKGLLVGLEA